jgi:O-antigen/teichoic acid export membrane protein
MTQMVTRVTTLTRALLHGGAAGDAGVAKGRQIASNVGVQLGARAIGMVLGVVTVSLTARTLGATEYGVWTGVGNYVGLFGVLTSLGFTNAATLRMAAEPEREAEWLGALVGARTAMSVVVTVVCWASIPLVLTNTHHSHAVGYILTLATLSTAATSLMTVFQTRLRSGLAVSFTVLQAFLWLGAVVALTVWHGSVVAFALANVLVILIVSILQIRVTRRLADIAWRAGLRLWGPLTRVAVPLGVAGVMITIYYQVDSVLLLQIAGPREAGIYGAAYGFLGPLIFLPAAIMGSFFPVLSAIHKRDPERSRRLVQVCADVMAVIGLPILAGAIALSAPIVHVIYGGEFSRAAGLLPILMIAFVVICFGTLAGNLSILLGLQWRFAVYTTVGALANVALNLILIPPYGAYGSAWATVATETLTMALMLLTSLRAIHLRLRMAKMLRATALAAGMTGVMALARPLGLIPAGTIGVLAYACGLLALRIVDRGELRTLVGRGGVG